MVDVERLHGQGLDVLGGEELGLLKDEAMKTGEVQILAAEYADPQLPFAHGVLQRKRMKAGPSEILVTSISAARGRAVIETIFSNEPIEDASHRVIVPCFARGSRPLGRTWNLAVCEGPGCGCWITAR